MRKALQQFGILCVFGATVALAASAMPAPAEQYLHVRVDDPSQGATVNVNLPLSMADKILPTINNGNLHGGRVTISQAQMNGVDVPALLAAIRTAADSEFVNIKRKDQDIHVAKVNGNIVIHAKDDLKSGREVDITVPMNVVDALFSTAKQNELDVAAAMRALGNAGDVLLVTVQEASRHIRIWVDSQKGTP